MGMQRLLGLRCAMAKLREQHQQVILVCNPASGDASQSHAERGTMHRIARDVFLCGGDMPRVGIPYHNEWAAVGSNSFLRSASKMQMDFNAAIFLRPSDQYKPCLLLLLHLRYN